MGKQVELLENHTDLRADDLDIFEILGKFCSINNDGALLVFFKAVNASNQGGLPGARGSADDNALRAGNLKIDVFQDMEVAKPFVHAFY